MLIGPLMGYVLMEQLKAKFTEIITGQLRQAMALVQVIILFVF
jgi:hypothetical protein